MSTSLAVLHDVGFTVLLRAGTPAPAEKGALILHRPAGEGLDAEAPTCPDCGKGHVVHEAGGLPGARRCDRCGSRWTDLALTPPPEWAGDLLDCALVTAARHSAEAPTVCDTCGEPLAGYSVDAESEYCTTCEPEPEKSAGARWQAVADALTDAEAATDREAAVVEAVVRYCRARAAGLTAAEAEAEAEE